MDDIELLAEYAAKNSDAAFRELVERHIPLVYSAAFRQTQDRQLAEDVTQAVFIILARKANRIAKRVVLSGWLYRAAWMAAKQAVRNELRRKKREQVASELASPNAEGELAGAWDQSAPIVDEALNHLSRKDRDAILLRFFHEKSLKEIGTALGCSEEAAKKRVSRALEKLRRFFGSRGVVLPSTVIATALSAYAVQPAPPETMSTASAMAASKGATATLSTLTLVKQIMKTMLLLKTQIGIGLLAPLLLLAALPFARSAPAGSLDASFQSQMPFDSPINALALQPDGKIVVGGQFVHGLRVGEQAVAYNGVARLNPDGSVDTTLKPFDERNVFAVAVQKDGKIVVAGLWDRTNSVKRANITRLNPDGALDQSFNPGSGTDWPNPATSVRLLAIQEDGKILLAGSFRSVAGEARSGLARLQVDGTLDHSFNAPTRPGDDVQALLLQPDGKLIVSAVLNQPPPSVQSPVFRLNSDGSLDSNFRAENIRRRPLALQPDGKVIGALPVKNFDDRTEPLTLVRLDSKGARDQSFSASVLDRGGRGLPGINKMLIQPNGKIIIAGQFNEVNGVEVGYLARLNSNGSVDTSFHTVAAFQGKPGPNDSPVVNAMLLDPDGRILIGGKFSKVDGEPRDSLARLMGDAPFRLNSASRSLNGLVQFVLHNAIGKHVHIEASANLQDWMRISTLTNQTGTLEFSESAPGILHRFYRAWAE